MSPPTISKLTFNRNASPIGIGQSTPCLTWRFGATEDTTKDWTQSAYELKVTRDGSSKNYEVKSSSNVDAPWPEKEAPLKSRQRVKVGIRAQGSDGEWTSWFEDTVEAALLKEDDWSADVISTDIKPATNDTKRPFYARKTFTLTQEEVDAIQAQGGARVYATALGVYELALNGTRVGDHVLAPGWQTYYYRLHYQTYVVPAKMFNVGENVIGAIVGEGWYAGRFGFTPLLRNIWGEEIGVMMQLEMPGKTVNTDKTWEWSYGPLIASELYDGEHFDCNLIDSKWSSPGSQSTSTWRPVKLINIPLTTKLIAPEAPPIRRLHQFKPVEVITTPKGRKIIDFGQNVAGWVKISNLPAKAQGDYTGAVTLRFAEVLDQGELGTRPLRLAKATDTVFLSSHVVPEWEPTFTTHGFRYCEVTTTGTEIDYQGFTAIVVHSDLEPLGDFSCSHKLVSKFHENVVWGLRGNFVGLPTDCPQRDERLGWTADQQVFTTTASYLYDTSGFLGDWLQDLSAEQLNDHDGVPPVISPDTGIRTNNKHLTFPQPVWSDAIVLVPEYLYRAYGSPIVLKEIFHSMCVWLDKGVPRNPNGLWDSKPIRFFFADWLDPKAPPDDAAAAMTDPYYVANSYLVGVTGIVAEIAKRLGDDAAHQKYTAEYKSLNEEFQKEYVTVNGRLISDSQTAFVLAFQFGLLKQEQIPRAAERLVELIEKEKYKIATGFAGTPEILNVLAANGHLETAYKMLEQTECPSWLYPVTMGATTVWERWDSLLPDGSINPGEMTSFNHYALGSMAHFLHSVVGGLAAAEPGWSKIRIAPRPGGSITSAKAHHITPQGWSSCEWTLSGGELQLKIEIPPNTKAEVLTSPDGKQTKEVGSGVYEMKLKWDA